MSTYEEKLEKMRNCPYMKARNGEYTCSMDGRTCITKEIRDKDDNVENVELRCEKEHTIADDMVIARKELDKLTSKPINITDVYRDDKHNIIICTDEPMDHNSVYGFMKEYSISEEVVKKVYNIIEEMKKVL